MALTLLQSLLIPCFVTFFGIIVYRLLFHPLARFPGPRFLACAGLSEFIVDIFYAGGGQFASQLHKWHDTYGPIVRVGPNEVHIRDSHYMEALYAPKGSQIRHKHPSIAYAMSTKGGTFGTVDHNLHRKRRKAISGLYSKKSVLAWEARLKAKTVELCEHLTSKSSTDPFDLRVCFLAWLYDFITENLLGFSSKLLTDETRASAYLQAFTDANHAFPWLKAFPWIFESILSCPRSVREMIPMLNIAVRSEIERAISDATAMAYSTAPAMEEITKAPPGATLFECILSSNIPPSDKSPDRMAEEAMEAIIAGSLSTGRMAASAMFWILDSPHVLRRLRKELDEQIPEWEDVELRHLENLPYLNACIQETMRITALDSSRAPLIIESVLQYGQYEIPAKTIVSMTFSNASLDESIFPNAFDFKPERWLESQERTAFLRSFVRPFGVGTRACLGADIAEAGLRMAVSAIIRKLGLDLYETTRERDIDKAFGGLIPEARSDSKGIRVVVKGPRARMQG